jgi:hypothetical protein
MVELMAAGVDAGQPLGDGNPHYRPNAPPVHYMERLPPDATVADELLYINEINKHLSRAQLVVILGYDYPECGWVDSDIAALCGGYTPKGIFSGMEYEWQCKFVHQYILQC